MDRILEFTIMHKERELADINVNFSTGEVEYKEYVHKIPYRQFYRTPNVHQIYDWIEGRCMPRNRANIREYLTSMGISSYDPIEMIKRTKGIMHADYLWTRFKDEELTWKDVQHRE